MNVQAIAHPDGIPRWLSHATPGRTHDLTAARAHGIVQACLTRQILVLADRAHQGAGATVRTPYYHYSEQPEQYQQFNRDHAHSEPPANVPLLNPRCGDYCSEPVVPPAVSAPPSNPSTPC